MRTIRLLASIGLAMLLAGCLVIVGGNQAPTATLSATPASLRSGERSDIFALATDPEGGPLTYAWYDSGARLAETGSVLRYYAPTLAYSTTRTIMVVVTDAGGASCQAAVSIGVRPAASGTLRVYNDSLDTVWYLYVSLQTSADWGDDRLGSATIPPGGWFDLEGIASGTYDLRADLFDNTPYWVDLSGTYIGDDLIVLWELH